jgi:hypothetical protein
VAFGFALFYRAGRIPKLGLGRRRLLLINTDAGRGKVKPNDVSGDEVEMRGGLGLTADSVGVLDELAAGGKNGANFPGKVVGNVGLKIHEREAGNDGADVVGVTGVFFQQLVELESIAGNDLGARKTNAKVIGHFGGSLDGDKAVFAQTTLDKGLADGPGAGTEFKGVVLRILWQPPGHGDGEISGTGQNGADLAGVIKEFLDKESRGVQLEFCKKLHVLGIKSDLYETFGHF